jgi:hypothetical protein
MNRKILVYINWFAALMALVVRYFWTTLFGFGINSILLDVAAFLLVAALSLVAFVKKGRDKKVLLAFAPLIVIALLPMLFVIATLIAWSTTGFAP